MPNLKGKQENPDPKTAVVWRSRWAKWFALGASMLVPVTLYLILVDYAPLEYIVIRTKEHQSPAVSVLDLVIYCFWTLAPPAWFFLEYNYHFPASLKQDKDAMDDMKYTQDLGSRFWAGLVLLFSTVLYYKYNVHGK